MGQDYTSIRREYTRGGLDEKRMPDSPWTMMEQWLEQARQADMPDPTAMSVATVDAEGQPWQRIVLLKRLNSEGLVFFTNTGSNKAKQLAQNPRISALFPWNMLDRQLIVQGVAESLPSSEVLRYFVTRPRESQLGAWVSRQSSRISARSVLESKFAEMKRKFADGDIPLPEFWGGYRIRPHRFEFWQGGAHRLHDRIEYVRTDDDHWTRQRLAP